MPPYAIQSLLYYDKFIMTNDCPVRFIDLVPYSFEVKRLGF
jgi:hypothetical protein